jgi:hypothetical protein
MTVLATAQQQFIKPKLVRKGTQLARVMTEKCGHESYRAHNKEQLCEQGLQAIFLTAQVSCGL